MNRLPLLLVSCLALPISASAAPVAVKTAPPPARPDLLFSVRSHIAALSRQPLASPGVSVRTPQAVPPSLAAPPLAQGVAVAQGSVHH